MISEKTYVHFGNTDLKTGKTGTFCAEHEKFSAKRLKGRSNLGKLQAELAEALAELAKLKSELGKVRPELGKARAELVKVRPEREEFADERAKVSAGWYNGLRSFCDAQTAWRREMSEPRQYEHLHKRGACELAQ